MRALLAQRMMFSVIPEDRTVDEDRITQRDLKGTAAATPDHAVTKESDSLLTAPCCP